jgi:hypothetical protein
MVSSSTIDRLRNSLWSGSRRSILVNSQQHSSSHIRFFELQRSEMRASKTADPEHYANPQPVSLYGLVRVKLEMHAQLAARIYKNCAQTPACGAAFSGYEWSIPMFRAEFLHGTSKSVEVSPNLPQRTGSSKQRNLCFLYT